MRNTGGIAPLCQARPLLGRGGRGRKRGRRSFRRLPLPVGDVPVLFSDKFQQSKVYVLKVLQIQFIDGWWDSPGSVVWRRRSCSLSSRSSSSLLWHRCKSPCIRDSPVAVHLVVDVPVVQLHQVSQVVDISVVTQRLFPIVQIILQTTVIPQLQSIDKVVDVPGLLIMQVPQRKCGHSSRRSLRKSS